MPTIPLPRKKCCLSIAALVLALPLSALGGIATSDDLYHLSLDQLLAVRIDVTSAARKAQPLEDTAAAIFVITRDDIRRSGFTRLPEVLRLAPGLQVARIDGGTWAISSRGFNAKNSDNLLVMMDGRVLHTPTFTGVYWNAQDVMLEDVDRIEVTRGPGGALWGANAVTGVINIVTRPAAATQGGFIGIGAGGREHQGSVRYGGALGEAGHYRVYARDSGEDSQQSAAGIRADDRTRLRGAGFRADMRLSGGASLTMQGDMYDGFSRHVGTRLDLPTATRTTVGYPIDLAGGNLLARWTQVVSAVEQWSLQFGHDSYRRDYFNLGERRATTDLDFQHRLPVGARHDVVWGLGYRTTADDMDNTAIVAFTPSRRRDKTLSAFVQDDIALVSDTLTLIAGGKLERNEHTGVEWQPNLRLRWKIDERQTAWAAMSRAVHTPSRTDLDGRVVSMATRTGSGILVTLLRNNPDVTSEKVLAYEAGWRIRPDKHIEFDIAAFHNRHRDMMTIEREAIYNDGPYRILPLVFHNLADATTHGVEWSASWRPSDAWHLKASQSWLRMRIARDAGSTDTSIETESGRSPRQQFQFHVYHFPGAAIELGASLYRVGALPSLDVPAYTRLDARIAWHPRPDLEVSLTGRNLLEAEHIEFVNASGPRTTAIPRSLFLATTWRF